MITRLQIGLIAGATLAVGIGMHIFILYQKIEALEIVVNNLQVEKAITQSNLGVCKSALDKSNGLIQGLKVEYNNNIAELVSWYQENPEIRYITIEKIREVKSNDCEDVKNVLDAVRDINTDRL